MQEPAVLHARRRDINPADYRGRGAQETDYATLITRPTIVLDAESGVPKIVYLELDDDCDELVARLKGVSYLVNGRGGTGLITRSRVFGFQPRLAIRGTDYCRAASLAVEDATTHALIASYAARVSTYYQRFNPDLYADHQRQVEKVLPDWQLEESVFTSGIVNDNNPLAYHFDAGNFRNVWSNMLVFKDRIEGGFLACPEFDIGFQLRHNSLLMFDGQNILHGVTPITLLAVDARRFSIVFYSLRGMWQCLPPGPELKRARKKRTAREFGRLERGGLSEKTAMERAAAGLGAMSEEERNALLTETQARGLAQIRNMESGLGAQRNVGAKGRAKVQKAILARAAAQATAGVGLPEEERAALYASVTAKRRAAAQEARETLRGGAPGKTGARART